MEEFNKNLKKTHSSFHQYMDLEFFEKTIQIFSWEQELQIQEELPDGIWLKFIGGYQFFFSESFVDGEISIRFKDAESNSLKDIYYLIKDYPSLDNSVVNRRTEKGNMSQTEKAGVRLYNQLSLVNLLESEIKKRDQNKV